MRQKKAALYPDTPHVYRCCGRDEAASQVEDSGSPAEKKGCCLKLQSHVQGYERILV